MRLVHYSKEIISLSDLHLDKQDITHNHFAKPSGFWVSDDDCEENWKSWCESEEFQVENLKYAHDVKLNTEANILYLRNANDIDKFSNLYSKKLCFGSPDLKKIDWAKVAQDFEGIIITPYIWERRFQTDAVWYYTWDCASGCIWNIDAIESITL